MEPKEFKDYVAKLKLANQMMGRPVKKIHKEAANPIKTGRRCRTGWIGEAFGREHEGRVAWASRFGIPTSCRGREGSAAYVFASVVARLPPEPDAVLQIAAERWQHSNSGRIGHGAESRKPGNHCSASMLELR